MIDLIAFDADDTLWHHETLYSRAQARFEELLAPYNHDGGVVARLYETEMGNLSTYGYGIKGFTLSMIETAIKITGGRIDGQDVLKIIDLAKEMQQAPVQLLDHVADVIPALSASYPLMLITKGDLFDQEAKLARSGLASYFTHMQVVSTKTVEVYRSLLERHQIDPQCFLMVGNSLKSDVLPVVNLGGHAVYIPYHITWTHEMVASQEDASNRYVQLEHFGLLPDFVERLRTGRYP